MKISLIITTYNWKEALELTLNSALDQSRLPDEIIVADDGSSDGTSELVKQVASKSKVQILHSWQEDRGFRAAKSRNKAIAVSENEYIILIDGDIILEHHFIEDHLKNALNGFFVQGSRVLLSCHKTENKLNKKLEHILFFDSGLGNRRNSIRSHFLSRLFSHETRKISGIRTCNFGFWKQDAAAVNGFNEDFIGWGREDSEFAVRLMNSGIKRRNLRFMAIAFHLFHQQRSRNDLKYNDELLDKALNEKLTWCDNGLEHHFSSQH